MRVILALAAAVFAAYLIFPPAFPFTHPDSAGYIAFAARRTVGYPLFLMGVESLFGTHRAAIPIQLFAMIGSAAFAANEIRKLTKSTLFGLATLALVIGNVFIYRYAFTILTEALFFSAIAVLTGLVCRFAGSPSRAIIGAMSLLVAVSILIRPASYIFIVVLAA